MVLIAVVEAQMKNVQEPPVSKTRDHFWKKFRKPRPMPATVEKD
jgi:hypothetical protein